MRHRPNTVIPAVMLSFTIVITAGAGPQEATVPRPSAAPVSVHWLVPLAAGHEEPQVVITEYKSEESERFLWDCLCKYAPSQQIAAGALGMFYRESFFKSNVVTGWATALAKTGRDIAEEFTAKIDAGLADGSTREIFVYEIQEVYGGYGLGQWCSTGYLTAFYDFAQDWGTTIGDAEMQCAFIMVSMEENEELWERLLTTEDASMAGRLIANLYDGTETGSDYIAALAECYYEKYADTETSEEFPRGLFFCIAKPRRRW